MRIGLLTADPEHPLVAGATALLTPRHEVSWVDPEGPGAPVPGSALADVYLLKARTPGALALAAELERRGAPVVNSASATALCQDRTAMAKTAAAAGLPFAATRTVSTLGALAAEPDLPYPLVVKSRHSRREDLVARVEAPERLRGLATAWADEPVVVQPYTVNSGWDHKLWVIDGHVFAALRRSELATGEDATGDAPRISPERLPTGWLDAVLAVGEVFDLDVYGVDVIDAGGGVPRIVDINAFPGARGQAGAPEALAALALRAAEEGPRPHRRTRRAGPPFRAVSGTARLQ